MDNDEHGLYIPALTPENTGRYTCAAENDSGKATCTAHLQVAEPAELIVSAIDDFGLKSKLEKSYKMSSVTKSSTTMQKSISSNTSEKISGGNVEFHKVATQEEHSMQKIGDKPIQEVHSSKKEEVHRNEPFGGGSVISQATKAFAHSGQVLENAAPQFQSVVATMNAPIAPKFTQPLESIVTDLGGKVEFLARVEGYPEPSVKWYKNGSEMFRPEYPCKFENGVATMTIPKAIEKDAARYTCTARNTAGTASSTAELLVKSIVQSAPQFVKSLQAQVVKSGTRVEMEVKVSGAPEPEIKWFKNGQPLTRTRGYNITRNGNVSTLLLSQAHSEDSGKYMVKASNAAGEAHSVVDFVVEQEDAKPTPAPPQQVALPHVKTTFSSKHVTIFEEKKQTVSKVSTVVPEVKSLPHKMDNVEVTVISKTDEHPKKECQIEHSASSSRLWTAPRFEKATIEPALVVEEEHPPPQPQPVHEDKFRVPPPPPPKPSPKTTPTPGAAPKHKQVFSESEDEFVRKELNFETVKREHPATFSPVVSPPPSKIPIYSPPPSTPSRFVPISGSPLPSSGCEDEPLQPAVWKPGGEQPVSTAWRPVRPPSGTPGKATPPVHLPAPSDFEQPRPMNLFQKSMHIKEEFSSVHKEVKTFSPKTAGPAKSPFGRAPAILPKEPSPPLPEPGPPPEFGYVDPKSVPRPTRTVVPPPPPTPTSMPKGGVAVYPGIPNAGTFTPPIRSAAHTPVFPKGTEVKPIPLKPGTPPEVGYVEPGVTRMRFSEETTTTSTTTTIVQKSGQQTEAPDQAPGGMTRPSAQIEFAPKSEVGSMPEVWSPQAGGPSAPVFVKPLQDRVVGEGEKVVLECIVQGEPTPEINWFKDGQVLPPLPELQSKYQYNVCQLTFPEALLKDQCTISCVAKNPAGSATTSAALRVKAKCEAPRGDSEDHQSSVASVIKRYNNAILASSTSSTSSNIFHKCSSRKITK